VGDLKNVGNDGDNVRNMISVKPFRLTALEYHRRGWIPFPLPPRDKFPPPEGATGKKNPVPEDRLERVTEYLADGFQARVDGRPQHFEADVCNIGLRMDHSVIGIDVDHYEAKHGADELAALEKKLGKLPVTWTSSARTDGHSGIRFFRIPNKYLPGSKLGGKHGLSFSGKAANAIDVVQYSHRYTAAPPSYHPDVQAEYRWFAPGEPLDKIPSGYRVEIKAVSERHERTEGPRDKSVEGYIASGYGATVRFLEEKTSIKIPYVEELPDLPEAWVLFLSRGGIRDDLKARDITSTERELLSWAAKNFPGGKSAAPCKTVRKAAETHKERMKTGESSHDKIVEMHWNIYNYALEGHRGALLTSARLEKLWTRTVLKGNTVHGQKRHLTEASGEIFRSRVEALRKIKGMADEVFEDGGNPFKTGCTCHDQEETQRELEQAGIPSGIGQIRDLEEYDHSDRGRGEMFRDMFTAERVKVVGSGDTSKWFFWKLDGTEFGWRQDNDLAMRLVEAISKAYKTKYTQLLQKYREQVAADDPEAKLTGGEMRKYRQLYESAGNAATIKNCLTMLGTLPDIRVEDTFFDHKPHLLGFDDGVVELLPGQPWKFRDKTFDDRVSMSVGRPFIGKSLRELAAVKDPGYLALLDYQKTFVPDLELWHFVQAILGYTLYGGNPSRQIYFFHGESSTGKSMLVNALQKALGPYGASSNGDVFNDKDGGRNPEIMKTRGKRLVQLPEFGDGHWITNDSLKRLASEDILSVRDNYAKSDQIVEFQQTATFIGPTNSVPRINGIDTAVKRRIVAVPFDEVMPDSQLDLDKANFLATQGRDAVIAWALEGWNAYSASGGGVLRSNNWPRVVTQRTKEFIGEMSSIGEFVEDYIKVTDKPEDKLYAKFVFSRYLVWADEQGIHESKRMDQRRLSRAIADFTGKKTQTVKNGKSVERGWSGVRLTGGNPKVQGRGFEVISEQSTEK
jgi:P4 family phage/plasmid primase-like protien